MQMLEERHAVFLMTFLSFVVRVFGFSFCLLGYFVYFPCINMGLPFCEKILPIEMHMIEPPTRPPISSLEFSLAVFPHDVVPVLNKNWRPSQFLDFLLESSLISWRSIQNLLLWDPDCFLDQPTYPCTSGRSGQAYGTARSAGSTFRGGPPVLWLNLFLFLFLFSPLLNNNFEENK